MQKFWIINQLENATAEILLYGFIGSEDVTASDFVRELKLHEASNNQINIRISSGGGSVFDGFAIFNAIKQSKVSIDTYIDGLAASMGSVIALAGKKTYMSNVARFMTHKASGFVFGNADEMRQNIELLEGLDNSIAAIYAAKTGLKVEECKTKYLGANDKWFNATEALNEKLIDGIYDAVQTIDVPKNATDEKIVWNIYNNQFKNIFTNNMKQIFLTAAALAVLKLTDNSDAAGAEAAIAALKKEADKVPGLETAVNEANTAKKLAEDTLAALKKTTVETSIKNLLDNALNTEKKITQQVYNELKEQYKEDVAGLTKLLAVLPKYSSVADKINDADEATKKLAAKTWDELDKEGKLEDLKAKDFETFKTKYKEEFGKDYTGK